MNECSFSVQNWTQANFHSSMKFPDPQTFLTFNTASGKLCKTLLKLASRHFVACVFGTKNNQNILCKYLFFFFSCNSKQKYLLNPFPLSPWSLKTRVPKTNRSPPIYTDSVASRGGSFHILTYIHFRTSLKQLKIHNKLPLCAPSSSSQGVLTNHSFPVSLSRFITHILYTHIHKAQWIELWSNTSMNTPNC